MPTVKYKGELYIGNDRLYSVGRKNEIMPVTEAIVIRRAGSKGRGIFAAKSFKKDDLIFIVAGPVLQDQWTHYTIPISEHLAIDPLSVHNPGMYINHACEPSAGVKNRTLIVAYRDIAKGEEVTLDYAMIVDEYGDEITDKELMCVCGSSRCRGRLGAYLRLPEPLRQAYKGYVSEWMLS